MTFQAHSHHFTRAHPVAEKNTLRVVALTALMMVVEIGAGWWFNSMALLADGWHMSSHTLALGISAMAYFWSRRLREDRRFSFGTWKIEVLGGYSSALMLALVAGLMLIESARRLLQPGPIQFDQAILVASLGLVVNLVSAFWLHDSHDHHDHDDHHHHADLNLRSAYLHVLADALTSVTALVALILGKKFGAIWLDPVMGILGSFLVGSWALGLLADTGRALLDAEMEQPGTRALREAVRQRLDGMQIHDLHLWRVAGAGYACILVLTPATHTTPEEVHRLLSELPQLLHTTVELHLPPGG